MAKFEEFIKGFEEKPKEAVNLAEQADIFKRSGLASHSYADDQDVYVVSPWTKDGKNNINAYHKLNGDLLKRFGKDKYSIKYLRDEARNNGTETAGVFKISFK